MKVASYQSFKYMLPAPSRFENWRGVYYPARMSPQSFLQRQREYQTEIADQKEKFTRDLQNTESTIQTFLASCASDQPNNAGPKSEWSLYQLMCQANDFALTNLAMECFDLLPSVCASTTPAYASPSVDLKTTLRTNSTTVTLPHHAFPSLVQSFTAKSVANFLYHSETHHDTLETIKKLGEWSGPQRVDEACFVIEVCEALWKRKHQGVQGADHVLRVQCWNALMDVMMTGGYHACRRVSGEVYDEMGRLGLQPTAETYLRLIRSLGLIGEVEEAESVFRWLTQRIGANTGWDAGAIRPYNALLEVYKENRLLEKSDRLWSRLIDARFPRINLTTVETYLRTLIDAAYTPLAGNISLFGNPLHSELKRIPLILQSAAEHGVAHEMLSPTLARHISNAFISYKIPVSMKYRWSRSDIQFKFLQMRKDAQYGDDVKELMDPQLPADSTEAPLPVPGARQVPSSTADYYGVYHKKNSWESLPADELFYQHTLEDRMEDTRMDSKVHVKRRYHWERSPNWMSENPPTRYDALYGSSKIPLESMGIRRHLSGDPGRPGLEVHVERDNVIVSSAIRAGRKFFRGTQSKGSTSTQQYYQDFVDT